MPDVVVVGTPGAFAASVFQFLQSTLPRLLPALRVVALDRNDDLAPCPPGEDRLVLSTFPPRALARRCRIDASEPVILRAEIASDLAFVRVNHRVSVVEALRPLSASLALIAELASTPDARFVAQSSDLPLGRFLGTLPPVRRAGIGPDEIAAACDAFGGADRPIGTDAAAWTAEQTAATEEDMQLARAVLDGLSGADETVEIVWPRATFLDGDRPGEAAPVATDVTGRARIIVYGPYFHLPRGAWHLRLALGFSDNVAGLPLHVRIGGRDSLGEVRILARDGGIFAADTAFDVEDAGEPIEIRLMSEQGAIEGRVALVSAILSPIRVDRQAAPLSPGG